MTNDDPVWVDLSPQEIEELRNKKHELTEYGKEQLRKLMNNQEPYPDEMFEEAERREAERREEEKKLPFYRFFAVNYFATGEGMSYWLKICRNYEPYDGVDHDMKRFMEFIGCTHYYSGIEEPTEEEFMTKYDNLIPSHMVKMIERKDQPCLDWETHFHVNYS